MNDTVIYNDNDYLILESKRLFSTGFNCYEKVDDTEDKYEKINPVNQWFVSIEAAKDWLSKYKSNK